MMHLPAATGCVSRSSAAGAGVAGADSKPAETVIRARSGAQSLVPSNETPLVASIVQNRTARNEVQYSLEPQATGIAAAKSGQLPV